MFSKLGMMLARSQLTRGFKSRAREEVMEPQRGGSTLGRLLKITLIGGGLYTAYQVHEILELDDRIQESLQPYEKIPTNWQVNGSIAALFGPPEPQRLLLTCTQTTLIRTGPYRVLSRIWGVMASTTLPVSLRAPVYGGWGKFFGSNLDEIQASSLDEYPSLAKFFTRELKKGARPLDPSKLVRPPPASTLCGGD